MNQSAKRQHHEQARKKHKHDSEQHARELARRPKSYAAAWVLGVIMVLAVGALLAVIFFA